MHKNFKLIILILVSALLLISCYLTRNTKTELVYKELSKNDTYLLNVTGNKVLMYDLKNLPKDKNYEITFMYEVYKNTEKIKEQIITGMLKDSTCEKVENDNEIIVMNLQENKIKSLLGNDKNNSYSSGECSIDENLFKYSFKYLTNNIDLSLGTEVYLFHATSSSSTRNFLQLGTHINQDELNDVLNENEENIFIKLIYKEV
ncbi:hypothetical protein UT300005_20510 [Clostridium sp. CTA-5]